MREPRVVCTLNDVANRQRSFRHPLFPPIVSQLSSIIEPPRFIRLEPDKTFGSMSQTREDIDRQLSLLLREARELQSRRNMLSPTCRLPPEVLAMIFVWVVEAEPGGEPEDFTVPRIKNWYPILHVCRRWRDVALDCPVLWTRIDVTNPRWTQEMLRLSKKAPLSLRAECYSTYSRIADACKEVLTHSDRLRTLHLSGFNECLVALSARITEAPNLRSLILRHCHWLADVHPCDLPETLLQNGAPRLERLELQKCTLSWDSPLLTSSPNVTKLVIQGLDKNKPTYAQLLRTVRNMASLRHLHLENSLPVPPTGFTDLPSFHLPLQTLYLSGTPLEMTGFFHAISIPSSISATLVCRQPERLEDVTDFIAAVVQARRCTSKGQNGCPEPLGSWSLSFTPKSLFISGSRAPTLVAISPEDSDTQPKDGSLSLTINMSSKGDDFLWSVIQTTLHALPIALATTTALTVSDDSDFMRCNCWQYLLKNMPNLSTLRAFRSAASELPPAIGIGKAHNDEVASKEELILIPRLETLQLHSVNMNWTVQPAGIPFLHALQDMQIARSNHWEPIPIPELRLSGCSNIGEQEIKTLCHLFTEVEWDGFEAYVASRARTDSEYAAYGREWLVNFIWEDWHTT